MNPLPDTLIGPTTAYRLRVTEKNEAFIQKLLELEVDAATVPSYRWRVSRILLSALQIGQMHFVRLGMFPT